MISACVPSMKAHIPSKTVRSSILYYSPTVNIVSARAQVCLPLVMSLSSVKHFRIPQCRGGRMSALSLMIQMVCRIGGRHRVRMIPSASDENLCMLASRELDILLRYRNCRSGTWGNNATSLLSLTDTATRDLHLTHDAALTTNGEGNQPFPLGFHFSISALNFAVRSLLATPVVTAVPLDTNTSRHSHYQRAGRSCRGTGLSCRRGCLALVP